MGQNSTLCWVPNIYNYSPTGYIHLSLIELAFFSFPLLTKLSYLLCYQFQWVTTFSFVKEKPGIKFDSSRSVTSPKFNQSLRAAFPTLFNSSNCPLLSSCSVPALTDAVITWYLLPCPSDSFIDHSSPFLFFIPLKISILKCHSHRSKSSLTPIPCLNVGSFTFSASQSSFHSACLHWLWTLHRCHSNSFCKPSLKNTSLQFKSLW